MGGAVSTLSGTRRNATGCAWNPASRVRFTPSADPLLWELQPDPHSTSAQHRPQPAHGPMLPRRQEDEEAIGFDAPTLLHPSLTMTIDTSEITDGMGFSSMPYAAGAFPSRVEIRSRNTTVRTPTPRTSSKIPRPMNLRLLLGGLSRRGLDPSHATGRHQVIAHRPGGVLCFI